MFERPVVAVAENTPIDVTQLVVHDSEVDRFGVSSVGLALAFDVELRQHNRADWDLVEH